MCESVGSSLLFFYLPPAAAHVSGIVRAAPTLLPSREKKRRRRLIREAEEKGGKLGNESLKFRTGLTKTTEKGGGGGGAADFYRIYLASLWPPTPMLRGKRGTVANFLCSRNASKVGQTGRPMKGE